MGYKTPVVVELYYSSAWHDITALGDVATTPPITITRGRPDETQQAAPGVCTLTLLNPDAKYSPRNPESALYGLIGRNTPIRVSVTGYGTRFVGEVESWPQLWDASERYAVVPITAYGILRRLGGAGSKARTDTAIHRYLMSGAQTGLISYWPLQDGDLTPHVGTTAVSLTYSDAAGTTNTTGELAPWLGNGVSLDGTIIMDVAFPAKPSGAFTFLDALALVRNGLPNDSGGAVTIGMYDAAIVDGNRYDYWLNSVWSAGVASLELVRHQVDGSSTVMHTYDAATAARLWDGQIHMVGLRLQGAGTNINVSLSIDGVNPSVSYSHGSTSTLWDQPRWKMAAAGLRSAGVGHVQLWARASSLSLADVYDPASGWVTEEAHDRISRICTEEGITCTVTGSTSAEMGAQGVGTVVDWLREAADADGGLLGEDRTQLGLTYATHASLYNQTVDVTLDYTAKEVSPPFQPTEDTRHVVNDVTVTRKGGGSSHVVQDTGPLNVNEPADDPQGVGRYPVEVTLNLATDAQTLQQAGWRKYVGTSDDPRYPSITANLTGLHEAGKTTLMADLAALDVAGRVEVTHPPKRQGPDTVSQRVEGYTETPAAKMWTVTFNTSPARPYDVGVLDTDRVTTAGCTTTEALDTTETGVDVTSPGARWSATAVPYDIVIGGERMTVTAVSGATAAQTLTVTRSVNGVVTTHTSGAAVDLCHPFRLAR